MDARVPQAVTEEQPTFAELFTPKLITILREGYGLRGFRADVLAGLTVAIVALPLSMAIAIASGTTPDRGLYTAIIGGFFISALGGSRFQVGGPAGAFIVLVAAAVARHGIEGVVLATMMSGVILLAMGFLRLGSYVKFMPYPVTVGFTAGIGVIIFASQVKDFFGLTLGAAEPGALLPKLAALATAAPTVNAAAVAMSVLTVGMILGLRRFWPRAPGMLLGVGLAALLVAAFQLPVETIGTRFGGIPHGLPMPALPPITLEKMIAVLPDAIAFAVLGAIEALLSAVVADGMTGRRHRSNCELVGQGVANIASGLFGGICATGTIARTATNVRSGAHGPIAGILHALFILGFMLVAAPLASYIPLAALAGVLTVVAWNMIERHAIAILARTSLGDSAVLAVTFLLTIFRDLSEGIVVGFGLGTLLFLHRMTQATRIELHLPDILEDKADTSNGGRTQYDSTMATNRDVMVYRLNGAFFFGTASTLGAILERIADSPKTFILDFAAVPFLDSTGANIIVGLAKNAQRSDTKLVISGASTATRTMLEGHDPQGTQLTFADSIAEALTRWAPRPA